MTQTCTQCGSPSQANARFCQNCGATLGATMVQGRTVIAQPPMQAAPPQGIDVKTIVQRAQKALGDAPISITPNEVTQTLLDQREQTVIVEDKSGSMAERYDDSMPKIEAAIRANINMVLNKARIDPQDEVGLVTFDSQAQILLHLCPIISHKQQIINTLQSLDAEGGTDINEGLLVARGLFDWSRKDVIRRIVLLTDGHGGHPIRTAEDLKENGVVIDVIGVGDCPSSVEEKLLKKVASVIQGELRYRFIKDHQTLIAHYTQLANKTATTA